MNMLWLLCAVAGARTLDVDVIDHAYVDADVTVEAGDSVRWFFLGPSMHSATAASDQDDWWDTGLVVPGVFSTHRFDVEGAFAYYCTAHGDDLGGGLVSGMTGSVTVVPPTPDSDGDGLSDLHETWFGADPAVADTDGDGLLDGDEVDVWGTDPIVVDSDGDGLTDGEEIGYGTVPTGFDTDGDDLSDGAEVLIHGTDPLNDDTDLGGLDDGDEIDLGLDPFDPSDDSRPMRLDPPGEFVLGAVNRFQVSNASPSLPVWLIIGLEPGALAVPGCPDLTLPWGRIIVADNDVVGVGGRTSLDAFIPEGASGREASFVAIQLDTCRRSARETVLFD